MTYTDGVQCFAQNAGGGAYWFLDIVATQIATIKEDFIAIKLSVPENETIATITATDGNDKLLFTKHVAYTDCPTGDWQFYLTNDVLLLPSEC